MALGFRGRRTYTKEGRTYTTESTCTYTTFTYTTQRMYVRAETIAIVGKDRSYSPLLPLLDHQRDCQPEMSGEGTAGPSRRQTDTRKRTHLAQSSGLEWPSHPQLWGIGRQIGLPAWMQLAIASLQDSICKDAHNATLVPLQRHLFFFKSHVGIEISETRWPQLTTGSPWRLLVTNHYPLITLTGAVTKHTLYKENTAFPCCMRTGKRKDNWKHFCVWKGRGDYTPLSSSLPLEIQISCISYICL